MLHRNMLFLISLPETTEYMAEGEAVRECIADLEALGVTVCHDISKEEIGRIGTYDAVVVIAHYDTDRDALVLQDAVLPISEFIASLPQHFSGVLDLSVCHSAEMVRSVKERCPGCHVQASLSNVPLLSRLIIYPHVAKLFLEDGETDYVTAYDTVSREFNDILEEVKEDDDGDTPVMAHLGKSLSTVYAKDTVTRDTLFTICVFFYYNEEERSVCLVQSSGYKRDEFIKHIDLEEGDIVDVHLDFICDNDDDRIHFMDGKDGHRTLTVGKDTSRIIYMLKVDADFKASSFFAEVTLSARSEEIAHLLFDINVDTQENNAPAKCVLREDVQQISHDGDILAQYNDIISETLLGKNAASVISSCLAAKKSDRERLEDLRRKMYIADLFYKEVNACKDKAEDSIRSLQRKYGFHSRIYTELLCHMRDALNKISQELNKVYDDFILRKKERHEDLTRDNGSFLKIEQKYLQQSKKLLSQLQQTKVLVKLDEISDKLKEEHPDREEIKEHISDLTYQLMTDGTDKMLFDILSVKSLPFSIWARRTNGTPYNYLALFIAMLTEDFDFINRTKKEASAELERFMEMGDNKKNIYKFLTELEKEETINRIKNYQRQMNGIVSPSVYYVQRLLVRKH